MSDAPLFRERDPLPAARRRFAPQVEDTSDVRRFRGVALAAVIGAVATAAAVIGLHDPNAMRSPGPLSIPHAQAKVACASCHDPGPPAATCVSCHGPHPSARAGHRAQQERGAMRCTTCHREHRDLGGIAIAADGHATRLGPGAAVPIDEPVAAPGVGPAVVPVVPLGACASCHAIDRANDPIAPCLLSGHAALGSDRPTVCFDEHRSVSAAAVNTDAALRDRLAVWAAARRALAIAPATPQGSPAQGGAFAVLGIGLGFAGLTLSAARLLSRRRRRAPSLPSAAMRPAMHRRLPAIDTATCIGCYACVDACPYDVLAVQAYVAKLVRPDDCCGLTLCEQRCPNGSLVITEGETIGDRPRIGEDLQSLDTPGVWVAGDLSGLSLIRNAIHQGAQAIDAIAASLRRDASRSDPNVHDVVIVGAGPAGLSAALAAEAAGLAYVVLEQAGVAESIRSFPRGKLVFDQPLGLPLVGDLWLRESTKEELVAKWIRIVRERSLRILEDHRVARVDHTSAGFDVRGVREGGPFTVHARRVLLTVGKRGTPRKLDVAIPEAAIDRVHYHLADARSFAGQRVVIVGLGDVAMEAALALSRQPDTHVTIVHRGEAFSRGKARNVEEIQRAIANGRIAMRWRSEIDEVGATSLRVRTDATSTSVPFDAVFVLIGAIAPWAFLAAAGVGRAGPEPMPVHLPIVQ